MSLSLLVRRGPVTPSHQNRFPVRSTWRSRRVLFDWGDMRDAWFEARVSNLGNLEPCPIRASTRFILALVFALFAWTSCQGQGGGSRMPEPIKISTIYVQVSLPNGRPAGGALVTLTPNSGVPRKAFANDSGRLEFPEMPDGQYKLTATSLSDSNLMSDVVETNPSR